MRASPRTFPSRLHLTAIAGLVGLVALLGACGDGPAATPDPLAPDALAARGGPATVVASGQFIAHLTGAEEVPAVETLAQGQATFRLSKDGTELSYRLIAANIVDVMMAHIHLAPAGVNGGVVVWLYPPDGPPPELIDGRFNGVLATGVITADDLVGALEGEPLTALLEEMRSGGAYVNVHTEANPGGEIRGQIR